MWLNIDVFCTRDMPINAQLLSTDAEGYGYWSYPLHTDCSHDSFVQVHIHATRSTVNLTDVYWQRCSNIENSKFIYLYVGNL